MHLSHPHMDVDTAETGHYIGHFWILASRFVNGRREREGRSEGRRVNEERQAINSVRLDHRPRNRTTSGRQHFPSRTPVRRAISITARICAWRTLLTLPAQLTGRRTTDTEIAAAVNRIGAGLFVPRTYTTTPSKDKRTHITIYRAPDTSNKGSPVTRPARPICFRERFNPDENMLSIWQRKKLTTRKQ